MRIESLRELSGQFPDIDGFWNFSNLPDSEMKMQNLLPQNQSPWSPEQVEVLTQLARLQALQDRWSEAKENMNLVQTLLPTLEEKSRARAEIRYLLEQGRLLCLQMSLVNAQTYFNQAWILSMRTGHFYFAVDAALMLSISQPPKFQNEWLQKALQLAESTQDPKAKLWLPQLYVMVGWHELDLRKFDDALSCFQKALKSAELIGDEKKLFPIRWSMARTLRALRAFDQALDIQKLLLSELNERNEVNGHVYWEIAECLQALGQIEESRPYFELAYKNLSRDTWFSDNKADELLRMEYLSKRH